MTSPLSPHRGVLFLCVHNSARSQLAEGLGRALLPSSWKVFSAGSQPSRVNPLAVESMREAGFDISGQRSKSVNEIDLSQVDLVVTLCAEEVCPVVPAGVRHESWAMPDPSAGPGSEAQKLEAFRRTRDEIRRRIEDLAAR